MSDRWETQSAPLPDGIVVQHTLYGEPQSQYLQAHTAPVGTEHMAVQPAVFSHIAWKPDVPPDRTKLCIAKDGTCKGSRVNGSFYCFGHDPDVRQRIAEGHRAKREA